MELNIHDYVWRETLIPLASGGPVRERFVVSYGDTHERFRTWEEAVAFFYSLIIPQTRS
jgi:hypothetical protein